MMFNPLMKYSQARERIEFPGCRRCLSRGSPRPEDTARGDEVRMLWRAEPTGPGLDAHRPAANTLLVPGPQLVRPPCPCSGHVTYPLLAGEPLEGDAVAQGHRGHPRRPPGPSPAMSGPLTPVQPLRENQAHLHCPAPNANTPSRSGTRTSKPPMLLITGESAAPISQEGTLRQEGRGCAHTPGGPSSPDACSLWHRSTARGQRCVTRPLTVMAQPRVFL